MENATSDFERRKQARLEKLGTDSPKCGICGNTDWRCLELHHIVGQKHDEACAILCANHHRMVTDDQKDHQSFNLEADPFMAGVGNFLVGLADMLKLIVEKLYEFGHELIKRATAPVDAVAS